MNKENINDMPFADTPAKTEEEQINPGHKKTRKKLRKAGIICIIASLPLMCIPFIGFPLLFAGLVMTMMGYAGKLARYQAAEIALTAPKAVLRQSPVLPVRGWPAVLRRAV
ncbi:MAG: hypothetical protein ACYSO3_05600 [Planctomycetota bacterium]|jgi:hypothetical protein